MTSAAFKPCHAKTDVKYTLMQFSIYVTAQKPFQNNLLLTIEIGKRCEINLMPKYKTDYQFNMFYGCVNYKIIEL